MVDAGDLKSPAFGRPGSIPGSGTKRYALGAETGIGARGADSVDAARSDSEPLALG